MQCDLLVKNALLLTMKAGDSTCIDGGFLATRGNTILAVGPSAELPESMQACKIIDARGKLVMPGLINGHTHAAMTLFRGLADDLPLMTWLQQYIFPAEARFVAPEMVYWCSKLAAAEMLLSGTTTVADGYFHEGMAARAFADAGMRAIAAQGVVDFPAPGVPDPASNIAVAETFLKNWAGKSPLIIPAVFCHSPYTCGPKTLQKAKELAERYDVPFFIHVAETQTEVAQILTHYGKTPLRHLDSLGLLDERTICIHCVHLDPDEIDLLKERGTKVVLCPESNMKLAAGCAPLPEMLRKGLAVGIGTDGCASNNDLDLFGEMDCCAKVHKLMANDPSVARAKDILAMATVNGARTLGMDHQIGSLEPGKRADFICIDLQQPHLLPFYNPDLLVYAARGADVSDVIIDGKMVVENGRLLAIDLDEVFVAMQPLIQSIKTSTL